MENNMKNILQHKEEILILQKEQIDSKIENLKVQISKLDQKIEKLRFQILNLEIQEKKKETKENQPRESTTVSKEIRIPRIGE